MAESSLSPRSTDRPTKEELERLKQRPRGEPHVLEPSGGAIEIPSVPSLPPRLCDFCDTNYAAANEWVGSANAALCDECLAYLAMHPKARRDFQTALEDVGNG